MDYIDKTFYNRLANKTVINLLPKLFPLKKSTANDFIQLVLYFKVTNLYFTLNISFISSISFFLFIFYN